MKGDVWKEITQPNFMRLGIWHCNVGRITLWIYSECTSVWHKWTDCVCLFMESCLIASEIFWRKLSGALFSLWDKCISTDLLICGEGILQNFLLCLICEPIYIYIYTYMREFWTIVPTVSCDFHKCFANFPLNLNS